MRNCKAKKLLKKIRKELIQFRKMFQEVADSGKPVMLRPGRAGLNADYLKELIEEINKVLK